MLDRVKTSIFDRLGASLAMPGSFPPVNVLDIFAGSGGFGLEALSRGAAHCRFVERGRTALTALWANIDALKCRQEVAVSATDALRLEPDCPWPGGYQVCFIDPPYRFTRDAATKAQLAGLIERLAASSHVNDSALILFRCESDVDLPAPTSCVEALDRRTYGRMALWWFKVSRSSIGSQQDGQADPS